MSILEALRSDCHHWGGTQEALSQSVCGSAAGLRHKLAGYKGSIMGLEEAQTIMLLTGGRATIEAQARELGGVYLQLPPVSDAIDNADLVLECHEIQRRLSAMFAALSEAIINDGRIDASEREGIDLLAHGVREQIIRYLGLSYRVYRDPTEPRE